MTRIPLTVLMAIGVLASSLAVLDVHDAVAQSQQPLVTTSIGVIRNLRREPNRPHYSIYPELQINAPLINNLVGLFALGGSAFVGGWREAGNSLDLSACGIDERRGYVCGQADPSHSGLLVGTRLNLVLTKALTYLSFSVGLTRQYIWTDRKWSESEEGVELSSTTLDAFNAIETGMRLQLSISRNLLLGAGVQVYWKVSASRHEIDPREAYTIGISYVRR